MSLSFLESLLLNKTIVLEYSLNTKKVVGAGPKKLLFPK